MRRLEIQNDLIQRGYCLMVIEADATWFAKDTDLHIGQLLHEFDIISADNFASRKERKEVSAGFSGYCGTKQVRDLFVEYTQGYAERLDPYVIHRRHR